MAESSVQCASGSSDDGGGGGGADGGGGVASIRGNYRPS